MELSFEDLAHQLQSPSIQYCFPPPTIQQLLYLRDQFLVVLMLH